MELLFDFLIILVLLIVIIVALRLFYKRKKNKNYNNNDSGFYDLSNDNAYRNAVYRQVNVDFKPYVKQLYQSIDELKAKTNRYNKEINQAQCDVMENIMRSADLLSKQIKTYWESAKFKKDFSYYISLHYASHLLAGALKSEQQNVKNAFVECKTRQEKWSNKIAIAQRQQEKAHGQQRIAISREIGEMCKVHKNISLWKSHIGGINSRYNERVTKQNIETANYREYIANNFGIRGQRWKQRCHQRAVQRGKK